MEKKILVLALAIMGLFFVGTAVAQEVLCDVTPQVDVDMSWYYSVIAPEGAPLTVSMRTDGNAVDLFLMNSADFDEYQSVQSGPATTFNYYVDGSSLNVVQKTYTFTVPNADRYYIVIDNTATPDNGAYAGVPVNVHVKVTGESAVSGFKAIFAIAAILGIALLCRRRKK